MFKPRERWVTVEDSILRGVQVLASPADTYTGTDETVLQIRVRVDGETYNGMFLIPEGVDTADALINFMDGTVRTWEHQVIKTLAASI